MKLVQLQKRQTVKSLFKFFKAVSQNSHFSWCCFPVWAPGRNAPFIRFWISALYKFACLYRMLPHLSFFHHFFLSSLLPYLSFPLRIDPLHFQARCWERQLNLAFVFYTYLVLYYISFDWWMRAFVVLGLVLSIQAKRLAWGNRLRSDLFCFERDVKPQLSQSILISLNMSRSHLIAVMTEDRGNQLWRCCDRAVCSRGWLTEAL